MKKYSITPEFQHSSMFLFFSVMYLFVTMGFAFWGYFVASVGYILSSIFLFCSLYYGLLYLCSKYYQINVSPGLITVWNVMNKPRNYRTDKLWWKIGKIPWYNSYFVLIYSSKRIPVAVVRPHWKNALKLLRLSHLGKLSSTELEYLKFLKNVGLL